MRHAPKAGFEIEQKYLCKGHTQMEAESMHSKIEHAIKNKPVYSPLDYVYAARFDRNIPKPHHVRHLSHDFFKAQKLETTVAALYEGKLPIKTSKYGHLQELKSVIQPCVYQPSVYHSFYDNLPQN